MLLCFLKEWSDEKNLFKPKVLIFATKIGKDSLFTGEKVQSILND
jgi:hypothetical protein